MIKIRKGTKILDVPKASYVAFYKPNGWVQIVKKSEMSPWEAKVKSASVSELRKMAQEHNIDTAGASKKALTKALLNKETAVKGEAVISKGE